MKQILSILLLFTILIACNTMFAYGEDIGGQPPTQNDGEATAAVALEPGGQPAEQSGEKPSKVDEFRSVNGLEQWRYDYDITGYAAGTYNLIIEAVDKAGNISTAGPYNIIIDPESDLPITNISYPTPGLRVGGNVNIVGTCIDDDAVAKVSVAINDGPFHLAQGTDFWSYNLNTQEMLDGLYTITAKGVDINGVEGRETTVVFNLDRHEPVFEITSHENGDLVNGRIELKGTVFDGNGIAAVSYSADGGETYHSLRYRGGRAAQMVEFSLNVDTTALPDGPQIYWFKGQDRMGSVGLSAFLFFVDNKAPQLEILYPTESDRVNGVFTVSGKATDEVGVERLTWQIGRVEPVEIPLRPGDPYWTQEFDYSGAKSADIRFTLVDKAGNTTEYRFRRELDFEADMPVVEFVTPVQDGMVKDDRIAGFLSDDDGVRGIIYSIDGGEEIFLDTGQAFDFVPAGPLAPGPRKVSVRGVDIHGLEGHAVEVGFVKVGPAPEIALATARAADGRTTPFDNGIEVRTDVHKSIDGSITFLNPPGTATYSFAGSESRPLTLKRNSAKGMHDFSIPIPAETIPFGVVGLLIEVTDGYGVSTEEQVYLFVKNLTRNDEEHGIYFHDARMKDGGPIAVDRTTPLRGRYIGYPAASVELDPPTDIVTVSESNGVIAIRPAKEGITAATTVKVTSNRGTVFSAGPFVFSTDTSPPQLTLDPGLTSGRPRAGVRLNGTVSDAESGVSLKYRLAGAEVAVLVSEGSFDTPLPLMSMPEEGALLTVTATDDAGNTAVEYRIINRTPRFTPDPNARRDPAPVITVLYPTPNAVILPRDFTKGNVYSGGVITGIESVAELYYTLNQGEELPVPEGDTFEVLLRDLEPGKYSISFRAVSGKGVSAQSSRISFTVAPAASRVEITSVSLDADVAVEFAPGADLPIGETTELLGAIKAELSVTGTFSVDGMEPARLRIDKTEAGDSVFSIPLVRYSGYGRHEISITITDTYGRETKLSTFYYRVVPKGSRSVTEREGLFIADSRFTGAGRIVAMEKGESVTVVFAGREIAQYRLEGQSSILELRKRENLFTLTTVADGVLEGIRLVVVTEDGDEFATPAFSILVDGEPPVIRLDRDITGEWVRESIDIGGIITDNLGVSDIAVAVNGQVVLTKQASVADGPTAVKELPFSVELPLAGIPEGNLTLSISASDEAGHQTVKEYLLKHDSTPPVIRQVTPELGEPVNGLLTFAGLVIDDGNIETVEFSGDGIEFTPVTGRPLFSGELDLNLYAATIDSIVYRVTDQAGNVGLYHPILNIDPESDKPVVQIQIPENGTLIQSDFTISGVAFDDDGVEKIYYRIDDGDFIPLEGGNSFEIELKLADLADNRHTVEVKAVDLGGVESDVETLWFNVSTAEPRSLLKVPEISETVKGVVEIRGESLDENGIRDVFISFDNGNTFNHTEGKESWSYFLDTRTLPDGTYSLLIRAVDTFGVEGLYTTLLNIDNTPPALELTGFMDREPVAELLNVRGRATDAIGLEGVRINVLPVIGDAYAPHPGIPATGPEEPPAVITLNLPPEEVILETIDISSLPQGLYNLQIAATDRANNVAYISRNFEKIESVQINSIEILFPAQGERLSGEFTLQGLVNAPSPPQKAALYVDGELFEALEVNRDGYFTYRCRPGNLTTEGFHTVMVEVLLPDGEVLQTDRRVIDYRKTGPWVTIDNFTAGDFAVNRPWIEGRAGYSTEAAPEDEREAKAFLRELEVTQIDYSVDNGRSFSSVRVGPDWRFRLETQSLPDGILSLMVRARFRNGEAAVAKTQLIIDETPPEVRLIYPEEGMRFNDTISLSGTAFDARGLTDVRVALRKGDKAQYAVPTFIQGLYIDAHFLGSTYFEAGAGLTFFDNNVKLSVFLGNSPSGGRFSGMVIGAKLLANIATLPYGYFFGPDWNFLSSSAAVGAAFSLFTMEPKEGSDTTAIVLAAVVVQLELARVEIAQWNIFNAFSAYIEGQLWFISSDVEGGIMPKIAFGIRSEVF